MLLKFYKTRVISICRCSLVHIHTTVCQREFRERNESLSRWMIFPNIYSCHQHKNQAGLLPINNMLYKMCTKYAGEKVSCFPNQWLASSLIPSKQSSLGRHSEKLVDRRQQLPARIAQIVNHCSLRLIRLDALTDHPADYSILWFFSLHVNMVSSDTLISAIEYIIITIKIIIITNS